ncbi:hypothetical protein ACA910_013025 [Epithemia clementina (nom. ined.)]
MMAIVGDENEMSDYSKMKGRTHQSSPMVRFETPRTVQRIMDQVEELRVSNSAASALKNHNHNTPRSFQSSSKIGLVEDASQILMNQSAASVNFTPILTPNRSGDVVLLSPSRTITETLTSLAALTGQQLEEVWDEVGYTPQERASQLNDLIVKFRDLCVAKIAEERGVAETFRQTIGEAKQEIEQLSAALQQPYSSDDTATNRSGLPATLTDELAMVETTLENLRSSAAQARKDLEECRDFLIDAHDALGIDMDSQWFDVDSNLTKQRQLQFQAKRAELKAELMSRSTAVVQLVRECQQLMRELKIDTDSGTSTEVDTQIAGSLVRSKDDSFMMASKHRTETCIGISGKAMEVLAKRLSELHAEKSRRKVRIHDMGLEISKLWEKLRVPEEEQISFTESVRGIGLDTIRKGEAELERLTTIKCEMIGQLIREAREEIEDLWDQIDADETYRRSFQAFFVEAENEFDDELLDAHEIYVGQLNERLEERKPILRLIERREAIVKERMEYEQLQKDPERLKQRTAAVARQVMEEEKMARRIKRDLPKLTSILKEKLAEWKERQGEEFMYQGAFYSDVIAQQETDWNAYKEQKKMHRKNDDNQHTSSDNAGGVTTKKPSQQRRHPRQPLADTKANNHSHYQYQKSRTTTTATHRVAMEHHS